MFSGTKVTSLEGKRSEIRFKLKPEFSGLLVSMSDCCDSGLSIFRKNKDMNTYRTISRDLMWKKRGYRAQNCTFRVKKFILILRCYPNLIRIFRSNRRIELNRRRFYYVRWNFIVCRIGGSRKTCGSYPYHENVNFDSQNLHALFCCIIRRPKCVWTTDWCKSRWLQSTKEEKLVKGSEQLCKGTQTEKKKKKNPSWADELWMKWKLVREYTPPGLRIIEQSANRHGIQTLNSARKQKTNTQTNKKENQNKNWN